MYCEAPGQKKPWYEWKTPMGFSSSPGVKCNTLEFCYFLLGPFWLRYEPLGRRGGGPSSQGLLVFLVLLYWFGGPPGGWGGPFLVNQNWVWELHSSSVSFPQILRQNPVWVAFGACSILPAGWRKPYQPCALFAPTLCTWNCPGLHTHLPIVYVRAGVGVGAGSCYAAPWASHLGCASNPAVGVGAGSRAGGGWWGGVGCRGGGCWELLWAS